MNKEATIQLAVAEFEKKIQLINPQLKVMIIDKGTQLSMEFITGLVSKYSGIPYEQITSKMRGKIEVSDARQIAMFFIKKNIKTSLKEVGIFFKRDHSSVLQAICKVQQFIDINDEKAMPIIEAVAAELKSITYKEQL